jgi:CO/xanthine dehydrogenase Mo-binding subunit
MERSCTLITAKNIPGKNELADIPVPILASQELSYLGEPVALLAGPNPAKLALYARQCEVLVQEEAPVFAAPASVLPEAPEPVPGDVPPPGGGADRPRGTGPEFFAERNLIRGNPEAAFAKAARIIGGIYSTGIQEHGYAEAVGALAEYQGTRSGAGARQEGSAGSPLFVIHSPTQWPYHVSRSAAGVLGLDPGRVVTEATDPGIHMDGRLWYPSLIACQAALASFLTRRNVRLILSREEDFRFSPKRNASVTRIQSALGDKGELLGTRIDLTVDLGARAVFARETLDQSCLGVLGIAGSGALELKARAIKTNIPPQGPCGGFGGAQGIYAMERHRSRIADALGMDPAEWRRNIQRGREGPGRIVAPGEPPPVEQLLGTAAAMSDYYRKWASYELLRRRRRQDPPRALPEARRGIGIALGWQGNGFLYAPGGGASAGEGGSGEESPGDDGYGVEVTLNMDGSLEIRSSVKAGRDFTHIWAHIVEEILGVEEDKVRFISRGTAQGPDSGPSCLSRNVTVIRTLIERCCQAIRNQRFRDPLPITVRETYRPDAVSPRGFGPPPGMVFDAESLRRPGWGAAVVEVEVEAHSYTPLIRGIWLGVDGGRILLEDQARRSLKLAVIQALGWAAREYLEYRAGGITAEQISGYGIPGPGEIPPIHIDFLWNDAVAPKGIGELPFGCVPAAYIQAVSQALDHPFQRIPQKPDHIWEVLRAKPAGGGTAGEGAAGGSGAAPADKPAGTASEGGTPASGSAAGEGAAGGSGAAPADEPAVTAEEGGAPATALPAPADEPAVTAEEGGVPVAESPMPAYNSAVTAEEGGAPVADSPMPASNSAGTASEGDAPASKSPTPATDSADTASESAASAAESPAPKAES